MGGYSGTNGNDFFQAYPEAGNWYSWSIYGNAGDDTLVGGPGSDYIDGGDGNDILRGGFGGYDTFYGGAGVDTVSYDLFPASFGGVNANLTTGATNFPNSGTPLTNTLLSIENLIGSAGNDTLTGNLFTNRLDGGDGNDLLDYGGGGNDTLDGGNGIDTVTYGSYSGAIYADLANGSTYVLANDGINIFVNTLTSIENLIGSQGNDTILGSAADNYLQGGTGNDSISGGSGNDTLDGGSGNDTLIGGLGNDVYYVDSVGDVVQEAPNQGTETVFASISYTLGANVENLTLTGTSNLNGIGNELDNLIQGNAGNNYLVAGDGNDTMIGGAGQDFMYGGAGNDILNGYGGAVGETDQLTGGTGADTFIVGDATKVFYQGAGNGDFAVIADFNAAEGDKIQLHGNAGNYLMGVGNAGVGTSASDGFLYYNNNGSIDLVAIIADVTNLSVNSTAFSYV
jgi:Ca2+-binding RTX toxin-like protein